MWKKTLDTLPQNVWHVEGYPVKSTPESSFYPDFFQGGSLKKVGCHTYKSEKMHVSTLKKSG